MLAKGDKIKSWWAESVYTITEVNKARVKAVSDDCGTAIEFSTEALIGLVRKGKFTKI